MLSRSAFAALWLALGAYAGVADLVAEGVLAGRNTAHLERQLERAADKVVKREMYHHVVVKRQSGSASVALNPNGTLNMTAWEDQVNTACSEALVKLPESSNPSGTCICYNLPVLNNKTGAFEADLRLYQLSTPTGDFAGIPPQNIQVGLSYIGASVSPVTSQTAQKLVAPRQSSSTNTGLKLLQTYLFVGQIDPAKMNAIMNSTQFDAQLEALVMPTLTLTAVNSDGQTVATNVSSNEAAFVAGAFSGDIVLSDFSKAQAAVDVLTQRLALFNNGTVLPTNETVAFVLPGVQIMIFPIGLIITSVWLLVFTAVVGMGTVQRMNFREQFRRRTAVAGGKGTDRI